MQSNGLSSHRSRVQVPSLPSKKMDRAELKKLKCWSCWWRKDGYCYEGDSGIEGRVLCGEKDTTKCDFRTKRSVLERAFGNLDIVIQSEQTGIPEEEKTVIKLIEEEG